MSLQKKTISGVFWAFTQQFSVLLVNFLISIVLARVLSPSQFGIIGLITIFVAIGTALIDGGMASSLIRTTNADQVDYSTVFFINIITSVFIYLVIFVAAPFIAVFFKQDILTGVIRLYTLSFIFNAFISVQKTKLQKEMNFKLQMTMQIPSLIGSGILGIYLAYKGFGVWSLVWRYLFQSFFYAAQLWIRTGWYPSWVISKEKFKYHFNFGYKIALTNVMNAIYDNLYNLIIGKSFQPAQLGYYTRAQTLKDLPVVNIAQALNRVTYPMFSAINDDDVRLKSAYKKLMQQIVFWIAATMLILGIIAEPLFRFMLTAKWLPAVPYFQILCVAAIMYPIKTYNLNILSVKGKSNLYFRVEFIEKIGTVIGILLVLPYGIFGLLYFQIFATVMAFYINSYYSGRLINYPMKEQLKDIVPILLLSAVVAVPAHFLNNFLKTTLRLNDILTIITITVFYFATYLGLGYIFKMQVIADFRQLVFKKGKL